MPKRRDSSGEGVSLFPFMSILACLIGILTLMISVTMQLKQMDNQGRTEEEKARAIENRDLKKEAEKLEAELAEAEKKLEREKATVSQLAKLEERRIVLEQQIEEDAKKDPDQTDAELQKLIELLKKETVALQRERPPLSKRLEELKAELAARKNPPKSVESVVIRPGGTGLSASASLFFVECNSTGIVIRSGPGAPITVSTASINDSEAYGQFLERVKRSRDSMVLFLVRRSGNDAYRWAAGIADSKYEVANGKLPIPNDGEIDLSLFEK
ncbi:MAG: hypothetical protein ABJQ29_10335 [Luteolibacter sp.]